MLENITFKTELGEILAVEEVSMLFDNISSRYYASLVSLSLFPEFNQLKKEVIAKAITRRNTELSKLLSEIAMRKREIKVDIWKVLGMMGANKKRQQEVFGDKADLEQLLYEEEQIINAYEESIKSLEIKEKKIMNGKYQRIDKIISTSNIKSLQKQIVNMRTRLMKISQKHDDCFAEFEERITEILDKTVITATTFPQSKKKAKVKSVDYSYDVEDGQMHYSRSHISKEYYQYEPIEADADDELIYQLLSQGDYADEDGTINELLIAVEEI